VSRHIQFATLSLSSVNLFFLKGRIRFTDEELLEQAQLISSEVKHPGLKALPVTLHDIRQPVGITTLKSLGVRGRPRRAT
jgi:hypothetical protein